MSDRRLRLERKIGERVAAEWVLHGYQVHSEMGLGHDFFKLGYGVRPDLIVENPYCHLSSKKKFLAIEVKCPRSIHDLATAVGQVLIYKTAIQHVWLAMSCTAVRRYKRLLNKLPVFVLDATNFTLYVKGKGYDAIKYWKGIRVGRN